MKYLFAVLLFAVTQFQAQAQSKAEKEVADAIEQLRLLMITPDSNKLVQAASDKLTYGHSSGLVEDRASFVNTLVSGKNDFTSITISDQTIHMMGNNAAVVRHLFEGEMLDNNRTSKVKIHILTVWEKEKGTWRLVARQAVRPPAQ